MSDARLVLRRHWLVIITVAALGIRLAYLVVFARTRALGWDAEVYRDLGRQLTTSGHYDLRCPWVQPCEGRPTMLFPPLFPLLSGLLARVGLGSILAGHFVMAGIGSATVAVMGLIGTRVGRMVGSAAVGPLAATCAAANPLWIALGGAAMAETLMLFLVSMVLASALWALDGDQIRRWLAPGALSGLAVLTHGEGTLLLVLAVIPAVAFWGRAGSRRLLAVGCLALAAIAVTSPWVARNVSVFGRATVAQPGWAGSWADVDAPGFRSGGYPDETPPILDGQRRSFAELDGTDELAYFDALQSEALAEIRANPSVVTPVSFRRVARTFGLVDPFQFQTGPIIIRRLITPFGWLLAIGGAIGLWLLRDRRAVAALFGGTVATVVIASAIVYGNPRFRVGAEPALTVCAAVAVVMLWRRASQKYQGNDDQSGSRFSKKASRPSAASSVM